MLTHDTPKPNIGASNHVAQVKRQPIILVIFDIRSYGIFRPYGFLFKLVLVVGPCLLWGNISALSFRRFDPDPHEICLANFTSS